MSGTSTNILGLTSDEFVEKRLSEGVSREESLDTYRRCFRAGEFDTLFTLPDVAREHHEHGTLKFALQLERGLEAESVILPIQSRADRLSYTLCVSSQIGCAMGCEFCETAQMGLLRNLAPAEIILQWFVARFHYAVPVRNIVFMGMGEPMDNLDAVLQAIRVFADRNGPCIAPSAIAVSTVGRTEGIRRYTQFAQQDGFHRVKLAVSVNAPNDDVRSAIMPINRAEPMSELMAAMQEWTRVATPILIEYVLIPTVNDADDHARELADWLQPLDCKINVIPYNPRRDSPWPAPEEADIDRFVAHLRAAGLLVKRRRTMGRSVMAACGQLGNPELRRSRTRIRVQQSADPS